ncbi:MAG: BolA/IbaG family iron-sulfur metabolism protein [Rhodospirillaceae bacterium]|jgi:BolA protein
MSVQTTIEAKITEALAPSHLEVINESHMHSVPPGSESHFKVVIVTDGFEGQLLIARQQKVNGILADELNGPVHALTMQTLTPSEWEDRGGVVPDSPDCLGGSKADA